jgi:hypothetical protein
MEQRIKEHFDDLRRGQKTCCDFEKGSRVKSSMQVDYDTFGKDSFEVYILEEMVSPEMCKEREAHCIAEYNATCPEYGYNKFNEKTDYVVTKHGLPPNRYKQSEGG